AVPAALFDTTLTSALLYVGGPAATVGTIASPAATLAEGVLRNMFVTKLKATLVIFLFVAAVGSGAGMFALPPGGSAADTSGVEIRKVSKQGQGRKDGEAPASKPANAGTGVPPPPAKDPGDFIDRLNKRMELPCLDDPNMTLHDALDFLTERSGLSFQVDEK